MKEGPVKKTIVTLTFDADGCDVMFISNAKLSLAESKEMVRKEWPPAREAVERWMGNEDEE